MTREIGGYFGLEFFLGKEYYDGLVGVNSARNALLYLLRARQVRKLYIPRFLCDSVSGLCRREGYPFEEYPIGRNFRPLFSGTLQEGEYLYIVNYYGQISNEEILKLKKRWGRIIVDNVQAFFQKPAAGVDTIYSCRKFFGVPDGAYAATDAVLEESLSRDVSMDRMRCILGRFEGNASDYYRDFQESETMFEQLPLRSMSELTRNILRAVDYEAVRKKRNENCVQLESLLGSSNPLQLNTPEGPYCYPFYCRDGLQIKKKLAEEKIYVPTLWPNVLKMENSMEKDYAENILPLPCDQRYTREDMLRIGRILKKIISEKY